MRNGEGEGEEEGEGEGEEEGEGEGEGQGEGQVGKLICRNILKCANDNSTFLLC